MKVEDIARICHEANLAICEANNDHTQKQWDNAEEWQRQSAIDGVRFALATPLASPEDQHNSWCADKLKNGWVYGEVKDKVAKTHPCLVSYDKLSFADKVKDYVFRSIVFACQHIKD